MLEVIWYKLDARVLSRRAIAMLDGAAVSIVFLGLSLAAVSGLLFSYGGAVAIGLILLNTAIAYYLFRALADIVRLLKKSAGIPFSGRIAAGPITSLYKCSDCNAILRSGLKCDSCGAEIEYD